MRASFHGGGWALVALVLCLPLAACGSGDDGLNGQPGQPGASTGLLVGQVLNALTGDPIVGATVTTTPAVNGVLITTDANGEYEAELPIGAYLLECAAMYYVDGEDAASVLAAETTEADFDLDPVARVIVEIVGAPATALPGVPFTLTVEARVMDGSVITGYDWDQLHGTEAGITSPGAVSTEIVPASGEDYKEDLIDNLTEYTGALDRYRVVGVNPHALEGTTELEFMVTVMTTSGDYDADEAIHTTLPFGAWATGTENVPVGLPVLLSGPDIGKWDWEISGPGDPVLFDPFTRYPWFIPGEAGMYVVSEFIGGAPALMGDGAVAEFKKDEVLEIYASEWHGGIGSVDGIIPEMDNGCTNACHAEVLRDTFDDWANTGHASIFTTQLNTSDHYGERCFACHTVGYDPTVVNGGIDDQDDYDAFLAWAFPGGHGHPDAGNFEYMLDNFPDSARLTNIQCENCHGPNGVGGAHLNDGSARMSLSSDMCAYCHGEPPRHARFQQWEESGHSNYELAIDESGGSCQNCHTAQGWLAAAPGWATLDGEPGERPNPSADEVHPQTCALCHDPHNVGMTSGANTDAEPRITDNAYNLASGFDATNVGKGAICSTCHNGRRGLVNDHTGLPNPDRAPHGGPQTDVLFGENAFFVDVGYRGAHSFLGDTCVTCHMQLTPPPAELSYNLSGTNHTFEASVDVCMECHGAFDGGTLKDQFEDSMEELEAGILDTLYEEIGVLLANGYTVLINGHAEDDEDTPVSFVITSLDDFDAEDMALTESHGRTAIDVTYGGETAYGARLGSGDPQGTLILFGESPLPNISGDSEFASLVSNGLFEPTSYMDLRPEVLIAQAAYNYFLLHNDGSHGFHYPSFAGDVLVSTGKVLENEIEWDFAEWLIVATGDFETDSTFYAVNVEEGTYVPLGTLDGTVRAIEYYKGTLYATVPGWYDFVGLYEVDLMDGTLTLITGEEDEWSGATADLLVIDGVLYGSPATDNAFFTSISMNDGIRTNIGDLVEDDLGGNAYGLSPDGTGLWWGDGVMYAVAPDTGEYESLFTDLDVSFLSSLHLYQNGVYALDLGNETLIRINEDGSFDTIVEFDDLDASLVGMTSVPAGAPQEN